ncbi:hypothetical protein LTR64_007528 [Lithohypha guttulata]|uniref:UBC core domain-containing protein n=1 Tax=Lithohypha guttulata TaxID=1690604 RepID=A0AAN7SXF4_9EURO|nr:hypothetical protein LTR51_007038 [Lithohypha guttulata]KAK5084227.1 hypothetical protein LTR05_005303 [Lithohypha guttulata]
MFAAKRLGKELQKARQKLPPGITLVKAEDLKTWEVDIKVLDSNPIYANQTYRLVFIFSQNYPIEPPEVTFLYVPANTQSSSSSSTALQLQSQTIDLTSEDPKPQSQADNGHRPIPIHPHIYSNGIICLDLLGTAGWSPVQSVESVCMSLQSMLTGNTKNERPEGDREFCASMGPRGKDGWSSKGGWGRRGLKDVRFTYEDDTV